MKFLQRFHHHLQYKGHNTCISSLFQVIYKGNIHDVTLTQYTRWKPESISWDRHKEIPMSAVTCSLLVHSGTTYSQFNS